MLGAKQEHKIPFTLDSSAAAPSLPVIHHLAAKALITDWETENKEKKSIVDLSIESSVISSHTAFIAIDEESSEPVSGAMKTYDVQAESFMSQYNCFGGGGGGGMRYGQMMCESGLRGGGIRSAGPILKKARVRWGVAPQLAQPMCGAPLPPPSNALKMVERSYLSASAGPFTNPSNTLANLIMAQQVNGSWALTSSFAQLLGKSLLELETACPIEKKGDGATVWATILAVSLLRVKYSSQQDEWELIVMKAESWLKKQTLPPGSTLEQLFQAAQKEL